MMKGSPLMFDALAKRHDIMANVFFGTEELVADAGANDANVSRKVVIDFVEHAAVFDDVLVNVNGAGPSANDICPISGPAMAGDPKIARAHFRRNDGQERSTGFQGINIVNGQTHGLIGQVLLIGRNVLLFDADLFKATNSNEVLPHAVFHSFDQCGERHEAGDPQG